MHIGPRSGACWALWLLAVFAALLWSFAAWTAYVKVPRARRLVADSNMRIDPVSREVLEQGGLALLVLALVGLLSALWTRSRWAWRFVLLGLPLVVGAVLYFISDHYESWLYEGLSK